MAQHQQQQQLLQHQLQCTPQHQQPDQLLFPQQQQQLLRIL